jgi:hypothetical protein
VTEVIGKKAARGFLILILVAAGCAFGQTPTPSPPLAHPTSATPTSPGPAQELYLQLRRVGLNPARTYKIRGATIDRPGLHLSLEDGIIAFTQDVQGRVTGALFGGDGEVLLTPPSREERASMALGTGMAILEERFSSAYLRFNDDTFADLQPFLRAAPDGTDFASHFESTAENLAELDAIRIFTTFSRSLPVGGDLPKVSTAPPVPLSVPDHYLHVRVEGEQLGPFDIHYDSLAFEPLSAGKSTEKDGISYYDVWTSFSPAAPGPVKEALADAEDVLKVDDFRLNADVKPPTDLNVDATLKVTVQSSGDRAVLFELSRFLQVKQVEINGHAAEFINNPALEGTQLARRGNDLVAVVFPQAIRKGDVFTLRFVYGGAVLSEAGGGLLYVGARGDWYPNRGLSTASFDLTFHYPVGWTLIATGNRVSGADDMNSSTPETTSPSMLEARWKTGRPIALAGFNLGKYIKASAQAGPVRIETYAARGVEKDFPRAPDPLPPLDPRGITPPPNLTIAPSSPSPAKHAQAVANEAAHAVEFFAQRFGPFPYSSLSLTQMPGSISQGWPGLIFLSSLSFLSAQEAEGLQMGSRRGSLRSIVLAHETAHQWWGDLVLWKSYRDQWIVEALANYSALMELESENPAEFRAVLEQYRKGLLEKNKDGKTLQDAGPVTLGQRLTSSQFPNGYEAVSYGRGTWLFHMLRYMLLDAEPVANRINSPEEPFTRILRKVSERYAGQPIDTHELMAAFAENLPKSLQFEGKQSLDWFEEGWVEGTSLPEFSLRNLKLVPKGNATIVSGVLLQKNAPPELVTSVPLYASVGRKTVFIGRIFADGPDTTFHLTAPAGTRGILVDPNGTLLTGGHL